MLKLKRRLRIKRMHMVTVTKSWSDAGITFTEFDCSSSSRTELCVKISSPGELREIRRNLDAIEQAWRDMIR